MDRIRLFISRQERTRAEKKHTEPHYTFDLDRMEAAVKAPAYRMPDGQSFEEFDAWMKKIAEKA